MARERTRLLQLVHAYPPAVGGVELSTRDLCERLVAEHGFDVTVLTTDVYSVTGFHDASQPRIPIVPNEVQNGVRIVRFPVTTIWSLPTKVLQAVAYRLRLPWNDYMRTWSSGPIAPAMRRAVASTPADVVCASSFPLNHMLYAFDGPRRPVVLVGAIHTNDSWGFDRRCMFRLANRAYATIAHTDHERDWLVAHGVDPGRVEVVAHGVDPDELVSAPGAFRARHGIAADDYVVAYLGQHAPHKGIDTLIAAFPDFVAAESRARLVIGGASTPFTSRLVAQVEALPAPARSKVLLLSNLDHDDKAGLLGDCDVFVSPSAMESFGITTLEAWACGKPVVVGNAGSQRSVVEDGRTGLIVPHGDVDALLAALASLTDPAVRQRMGAAGREVLLSRYRRDVIERRYAEILRAAASSGPGKSSSSVS